MVAQNRVASLDRGGQLGLGAADLGGAQRVNVEIEPAQAKDVGIAGRVPCSSSAGCPTGPSRSGRTGLKVT